MRIVLQRVSSASVDVNQQQIATINEGLLLLVGFGSADADNIQNQFTQICTKLVNLRVFSNQQGKLDHSVIDISGDILAVPQFTLYGKSQKGRRPDFTDALTPDIALQYFNSFARILSNTLGKEVATGEFGVDMKVALVNDGPFTLQFDY